MVCGKAEVSGLGKIMAQMALMATKMARFGDQVQTGDQLAAGQAIVQEWAQTMQQGVPRFQDRQAVCSF